jgi:NAD(P)H-dependent FMN reductase
MTKPVLHVIIGSTRPGRVGPAVAQWFYDIASLDEDFDVELVDLATFNLPVYDEPNHPMRGDYKFEHTKKWSASVTRADAIVFVIPEYNHSFNAAMKNAIDYLHNEWRYKPVGVVSYGGAAMGTRALEALKPVLVALKLPFAGEVTIPLTFVPIVDGIFPGNDVLVASAQALMKELGVLTPVYQELRRS